MSGLRFRLAGIPVRVEPVFFLIIVLIGGLDRPGILILTFAATAFVSILFHEFAHAFAFRAFGRSPSIVLHAFGGLTGAPGAPLSRARDVLVSAVGPLSQIIVLGIPALMLRLPVARAFRSVNWYIALTDAAWINIGWGILNLMPVLPLDGGRIMAGLLGGRRHGLRIAHAIGVVVAAAGAAWGLANQRIFLALFGAMFVAINVAGFRDQRNAPHIARVREGHARLDAGDAAGAAHAARAVLDDPVAAARVRTEAAELAAWAMLSRGEREAAAEVLARLPQGTERSAYLAAFTAIERGDHDAGLVVAARAFAAGDGPPPNHLLAMRLSREGLVERLAAILRGADDEGRALGELEQALREAGLHEEASRVAGL
ncbi:MAG TPA: site-2 protease family protein [Actinomycetota bacterium]|nr:site-2 protease family protein [Actinomycetota bacterium]